MIGDTSKSEQGANTVIEKRLSTSRTSEMRNPEEMFEEADRLEELGAKEQALGIWRRLAASDPSVTILCRLGSLAEELGLVAEAERVFQTASERDRAAPLPLIELGILAIHLQDYDSAVRHLKDAVRCEESAMGYSLLGHALGSIGREEEEESAYRDALRVDPNYEEAHYNLAVLLAQRRPSEAVANLKRALELDPNYAAAHRELGLAMRKSGSRPEAEYHLRRAIELNAGDPWAHVYLGNYLWSGGLVEAAIAEFHFAIQAAPDRAFPLWALGNVYEDRKDFDLARRTYERALEVEPDSVVGNMKLGRLLKKKGDRALAREYLNRAIFLDPSYVPARTLLKEIG